MDIGDKVRKVKGNPFGKIGIIKRTLPMVGPVTLTEDPRGLKDNPYVMYFECEAEDGVTFRGTEDDLEFVK